MSTYVSFARGFPSACFVRSVTRNPSLLDPRESARKVSDEVQAESAKPITILLVGNEEADVFMFRRALGKLDFRGDVRVVAGVMQARHYLEGVGSFHNRTYFPLPDFIISDLKMEGESGLHFLEWIREKKDFASIPVYMLSGSGLPPDREKALELGAKKYFTKTGDFQELLRRVSELLAHAEQNRGRST